MIRTTVLALILSVMFPSTSYAGWSFVGTEASSRNVFYLDNHRIRKRGPYIYYWILQNAPKRDVDGIRSVLMYMQGDCAQIRFKTLSFVYHSKSMGEGRAKAENSLDKQWYYPPPETISELILNRACRYTK